MNPRVSAIIAAFYPGQATGIGLLNAMTDHTMPKFGRLPYTWFYSADQVPPIVNYTMVDRTYRYTTKQPLYPFGYGLTYGIFVYSQLTYKQEINAGDSQSGQVMVANRGEFDADEVVQVYLKWNSPSVTTQNIQLVDFNRVTLAKNDLAIVKFSIAPQDMAVWTDDKGWVIEEGIISFYVGGSQPGQPAKRTMRTGIIPGTFQIKGTKILGFN
ncbi:hypothetical protein LOTGIDRAFT_239740 [Lottia gigantea]|uniref:beta-glucosidase n=1 Tax=Lottia gigantea TaxID=225164 RepID=V4A5L0_LOTGI|nr:hypothetical protein LOTGIDRAFT_239740 [Lottia gigantea]ESO99213.1 hypothetical protein LOTGIDRAFT_239740 [Lottia gigantea]